MNSHNYHRRKNKIPQKRHLPDFEKNQFSNELTELNIFENDNKLDLNDNEYLKNDTENLQKDNGKSFKLNYSQISAVELIHGVIPAPRFENQCNQLRGLYDDIKTMCVNIDQLIDKYVQQHSNTTILQNIPHNSSELLIKKSYNERCKEIQISKNQSITELNNNFRVKRKTFRGTSDEENEINPSYKPVELNNEIVLSKCYPEIRVGKDLFYMMLLKASNSATRLIRLLMKNFFSQKILAVSSLSGEGYYKQKLNSQVIAAIKEFIKARYPKLKNGSINLCMTDVCVQARRVCRTKSKAIIVDH